MKTLASKQVKVVDSLDETIYAETTMQNLADLAALADSDIESISM